MAAADDVGDGAALAGPPGTAGDWARVAEGRGRTAGGETTGTVERGRGETT
ncbi:hypothetical protein [Actinacidiphila acidipaludis]|uniref:Uncharacterized protein n=1 Tax=Actinacidiphila acidipaludis TaxID=2873382 RepID=A0ABS7Q561_9ACTN|nr:hypothetical protein [Streptomyces acidipaludis]MBY8877560.1 hypothetical protein [Streptomyces acidipaludis]